MLESDLNRLFLAGTIDQIEAGNFYFGDRERPIRQIDFSISNLNGDRSFRVGTSQSPVIRTLRLCISSTHWTVSDSMVSGGLNELSQQMKNMNCMEYSYRFCLFLFVEMV